MAQSVKQPKLLTIDLCSGLDLRVVSLSPALGLHAGREAHLKKKREKYQIQMSIITKTNETPIHMGFQKEGFSYPSPCRV